VLSPTWELTTHERPFADILATFVGFLTDADDTRPAGCLLAMMRVLSSDLGPATKAAGVSGRPPRTLWAPPSRPVGSRPGSRDPDRGVGDPDRR
jgi:hypothetical protein